MFLIVQCVLLCHRGCLNFTLLLSSDLRISFVCVGGGGWDDGQTERLTMFSDASLFYAVIVEEIDEDQSGCSLETHLHSCLLGPSVRNFQASSSTVTAPWAGVRVDGFEWSNSEREYTISSQSRILNSSRSALREKVRQPGDLHLPVGSSFMTEAVLKLSEEHKSLLLAPFSLRIIVGTLYGFPHRGHQWQNTQLCFLNPFTTTMLYPFIRYWEYGTNNILPQMPPLDLASAPSLEFPTFYQIL
ncbi:Protein TIFY 6B [Bienertia sinuspersici]